MQRHVADYLSMMGSGNALSKIEFPQVDESKMQVMSIEIFHLSKMLPCI